MVQLIAAIATDAEHMPSLLYAMRNVLASPEAKAHESWGVGYFADDHALIIRKPGELLQNRSFHELAASVRSRVLIAAVQENATKTNQGPPFRFRRWLFGSVGDLSPLQALRSRILEALPDFIRSEISHGTPGELAFAMFLRELHQRGVLSDPLIEGKPLAECMKRTITAMSMLASEAGVAVPAASYAATNGRTVIGARMGPALYWRRQEGLEAAPEGSGSGPHDPSVKEIQRMVDVLKNFRAIVLASGHASTKGDWTEIPEGSVIWVDRQLVVSPLPG